MRFRRRLHLQLTPLLDLLLIVIFAQYMDVAEREATRVGEANEAIEQRESIAAELAQLQGSHQQTRERVLQLQQVAEELRTQNTSLTAELEQTDGDLRRAIAQQQLLGDLVSELFDVPGDTVADALTPPGAELPDSDDRREILQSQFEELSLQNSGRMIRHLLSYEEMRKRTDLWEIHIDDAGWITLYVGKDEYGFRARTPGQFTDELYAVYKSLPQPKSLVVIMLSWGDTRADVREAAIRALPVVTEQMRQNAGGFIRFEYAILGFQPAPQR